jgi:hypothetical protein
MVANTPQALKVLLSIKPEVKQQRRTGIEVREFLISRERWLMDFGFDFWSSSLPEEAIVAVHSLWFQCTLCQMSGIER